MDVMVVGGGGREHAIIDSLRKNPTVKTIYALPGNGGIAQSATCVPIGATDIPAIVDFAVNNNVDFAVVAPDDPLVLGAVDALESAGVPCFGPNAAAAIIEGSKSFAKQLMVDNAIPTAAYEHFTEEGPAQDYLERRPDTDFPVVIKADGLALGKGVIIAANRDEAQLAVHSMMAEGAFGDAGKQVVIEEFLTGPEVTVLAFTDGETLVPMISSMDHKRAFDDDQGPNTGGMGVVAPNPYYTIEIAEECQTKIFEPTVAAMASLGRPFKGCLYFGLILTPQGPKIIEYNCRFGDPEAQAVLPLLESDLLEILLATREERLDQVDVSFSDNSSCTVVLASGGYPGPYETGMPIGFSSNLDEGIEVFHAGTAIRDGEELVTAGGRVLAVTATGPDLATAINRAYDGADKITFVNQHSRRDIGAIALQATAASSAPAGEQI